MIMIISVSLTAFAYILYLYITYMIMIISASLTAFARYYLVQIIKGMGI